VTPGEDPLVTETIDVIGHPVATRIDALLTVELERWSSLDESLAEPLQSLRRFVLAGGKRLRPAFCYWTFVGAGGDPSDQEIVDAGAALELLHSFALVHDDVMDDSRQRRGNDAVHVQLQHLHQREHLSGEDRRFGEGVAILVGDMAFVYADHLMKAAPRAAIDVFTEMRVELNVGQYLDLSATARSEATVEKAQKIATYKSGKYTVERPMHLGAAMAGRFEELASDITAYGIPVGEAFQLRDDLLGAFGDEDLTGKPVGGDLREGKPTALLAIARERAGSDDAKLLVQRYGSRDLHDDEIRDIQRIFTETGARADVETTIEQLVESGLNALAKTQITPEAQDHLVQLAYFVAGRHH
jgi:geranylgeranyl diphosphate synthase, type I